MPKEVRSGESSACDRLNIETLEQGRTRSIPWLLKDQPDAQPTSLRNLIMTEGISQKMLASPTPRLI
jgi:hypothetical protein